MVGTGRLNYYLFSMLHSLALWGYYFVSEGALAVSRECLAVSPEEMHIQRALLRTYLERCSVHVCIQ